MDWFEQINNYCERTDFAFWSEPLNALSNLSFILFAWLAWRMLGGQRDAGARALILLLAGIGIGSSLFHTFATRWAELADVLPITLFILVYFYLAVRRFLGFPLWAGLAAVFGFFPYSFGLSSVLNNLFGSINGSVAYVPVVVLIVLLAGVILPRDRITATGLALGAAALGISLVFRSIDMEICTAFPLGTHFLWHLINGAMLGWMILVMHRQQTARNN